MYLGPLLQSVNSLIHQTNVYFTGFYFQMQNQIACNNNIIITLPTLQIPLFESWSTGQLRKLVDQLPSFPLMIYPSESVVMMEGDKLQRVLVLVKGRFVVQIIVIRQLILVTFIETPL